jgi:metallophosphoesterase (TIGR03767 family)
VHPSRRDLLRAASATGAVLALPPRWFPSRRSAPKPAIDPRGTTLERTVLRAVQELRQGYRLLVAGPGEPHVVRDDLGAHAAAGRETRRKTVTSFVQFTDMHLLDTQSPARVEFLDRYSDQPTSQVPFEAAWRPHEPLTLHLAETIVRAVRTVGRGPVTGKTFEFTICTGDNVDNTQRNEVRWFVDLLDGRTVTPDSGDLTKYEGVQDADALTYDVHYWHPDGTPAGKQDDQARGLYGFPSVRGLLDAARRPFKATGVGMPWYAAFGNHDPLLQGNAPAFVTIGETEVPTAFSAVATGSVKVVDLPAGLSPADAQRGLIARDPAVLTALATGPARVVSADPGRRPLSKREFMAEMFDTLGTPVGHGFGRDNITANRGYYAFDHGAYLRCVVLDTVNAGGYSEGSLDAEQFAWLKAELDTVAGGTRLAVVFSHHPASSMNNPTLAPDDTGPRVMGDDVVALLLTVPNVVLWVNGHTHRNDVVAHTGPGGGFWEVNTAAHIDFPHQSRILEIVDNLDGTLSIFATIVDAAAPLTVSAAAAYDAPASVSGLAALGRELGANDWQARPAAGGDLNGGRRGTPDVRNVELLVRAPFELGLGAKPRGPAVPPGVLGTRNGPRIVSTGLPESAPAVAAALAVAAAGLAAARRRAEEPRTDTGTGDGA